MNEPAFRGLGHPGNEREHPGIDPGTPDFCFNTGSRTTNQEEAMRIQHLALTALLGLGLAAGCGGADQADTDAAAGAEEVSELTEPADAAPAEADPADLEPDVEEDEEQEESEE
jgi:hypothetical protein